MRFVITRREALDLADGINAFIFSLSSALINKGHEVIAITASHSSNEKIESHFGRGAFTDTHCLSDNPRPTHREMISAWRHRGIALVRSLHPDLTIVNGALPLRLPSTSCTVSHDLERRWSYGSALRRAYKIHAYRRTTSIVATCTELRDALASEIWTDPSKIAVIPTCVSLSSYERCALAERERAILHMGTPEYKNPQATVEAFAKMTEPACLYITGKPPVDLLALVAAQPRPVAERISFLGIVEASALKRLLSRVRVLSVPSIYATPVASPTVLDGLAAGTPVVGSTSISQDLLGRSGRFRVDPRNTTELAARFDLLLRNDAVWRAASTAGLARAPNFDSEVVAQRYENIAKKMLPHACEPSHCGEQTSR